MFQIDSVPSTCEALQGHEVAVFRVTGSTFVTVHLLDTAPTAAIP